MSADLLREAAAKMRERADAAITGTWRDDFGRVTTEISEGGYGTALICSPMRLSDAEHIASWHPAVALAVADWLEDEADRIPPNETHAITGRGIKIPLEESPAVRLARAYLGSDQ